MMLRLERKCRVTGSSAYGAAEKSRRRIVCAPPGVANVHADAISRALSLHRTFHRKCYGLVSPPLLSIGIDADIIGAMVAFHSIGREYGPAGANSARASPNIAADMPARTRGQFYVHSTVFSCGIDRGLRRHLAIHTLLRAHTSPSSPSSAPRLARARKGGICQLSSRSRRRRRRRARARGGAQGLEQGRHAPASTTKQAAVLSRFVTRAGESISCCRARSCRNPLTHIPGCCGSSCAKRTRALMATRSTRRTS